MPNKVAAVTGANKGIGFAIVKGLCQRFDGVVYLTARNEERGLESVKKLNEIGLKPKFHILDVSDVQSVKKFANFIKTEHGGLDVLVNNAAILEAEQIYPSYEAAKRNIDINYRSLLTMEKYVYPLLRKGARVVNISSACGHLSNLKNKKWTKRLQDKDLTEEKLNEFVNEYLESVKNGTFEKNDFVDDGKHAEHRVSKIALTALTMIQQRKYYSKNISINAVYPGHVKTDMAKGTGSITTDEAAKLPLYLIFDDSPALKGVFLWENADVIDWYDAGGDFYWKCIW